MLNAEREAALVLSLVLGSGRSQKRRGGGGGGKHVYLIL